MKNTHRLLIGLLALSAVPAAFADGFQAHPYLGASAGQSRYSNSGGHSTSGEVYGGYQFSPNLAVEAQYTDLGNRNGLKAKGAGADLVGILPVGSNFSLIGKAGVARMKTENDNLAGAPNVERSAPHFAVGASYAFAPDMSAVAEVDHYDNIGDSTTGGQGHADTASVGVNYAF